MISLVGSITWNKTNDPKVTEALGGLLCLLHAHKLARVDQVVSGTELFPKQQMLQCRDPGCHLR